MTLKIKTVKSKLLLGNLTVLLVLTISACQQHKTPQVKSWQLNPEYSKISIITTKNDSVAEVSSFKSFKGSINKNNYLEIEIDLNSLETNIPIRNERIQKHLFQSDIYPTADIHTQLKPEDLTSGVHNITFDVDLHGISGILTAEFMVFEQLGNKVITLHSPLIIKAEDFGLEHGIVTLRKLAKLSSIDFTVPVNIILSFSPE